jgi:hypothetical protein
MITAVIVLPTWQQKLMIYRHRRRVGAIPAAPAGEVIIGRLNGNDAFR